MSVTPSASTPVTPPGVPGAANADAAETSVESAGLFAQLMAALVPQAAAPAPEEQPTGDQASDAQATPTPPSLVAPVNDPSPLPTTGLPTGPVPGRKTTPTLAVTTADSSAATEPPTVAAPQPVPLPTTTPPTPGTTTPAPALGILRPVSALAPLAGAPLPEPTPAGHSSRPSAEPLNVEPLNTGAGVSTAPGLSGPAASAGVPTTPSTARSAPAAAPAPLPVSRQVIPELTRMSTLGEGVHRLTMTLRPEALGEVRVTMTVRDGSLHVRLAAGSEAQHALVPDLTELQQVLKLGSGSDVRVVLRDLAGAPATSDQQSSQTGGQAGQQGAGHHAGHGAPTGGDPGTTPGSGHHSRREAGTPRDINATDGAVDGTSGSRSQAVRRVRPTGVDLTM